MRTILRMVLLFSSAIVYLQAQATPSDCAFSATFTSATTGSTVTNSSIPCVSWRVTYTSTGFSALSIRFETSPDASSWTAVTNSVCSSTVQPPCVIDGANPTTSTGSATFAVRAYGKYVRLNVTSITGSGSIATTSYGYKGLSAQVGAGGGGGSGATANLVYCAPASASTTAYTCSPTPALTAYAAGVGVEFVPDVAGAGGATSVNISGLGTRPIVLGDGATLPSATTFAKKMSYLLIDDGASLRLQARTARLPEMTSSPVPSAPSSALGTAGALTATNAVWYMTCVTPQGETLWSAASSPVLAPSSQRVVLTIALCSDPATTGRNIYRGSTQDPGGPYKVTSGTASTVTDNTSTSYTDNAAANTLSGNYRLPGINSTSWLTKDGVTVGIVSQGSPNTTLLGGNVLLGFGTPSGIPFPEQALTYMTAIGDSACAQCTSVPGGNTSLFVTAIGASALRTHTSGDHATAVGTVAGEQQRGNRITAIGSHSLRGSSNTADGNTAVGAYSLNGLNNNAGTGNTAVGDGSGEFISSGASNVLIGQSAGKNTTRGPSGQTLTTQSKNTMLGAVSNLQGNFANGIAIGFGAPVVGNNKMSIGGYSTGSETAALGFYNGVQVDGMPVMAVPKVDLTGQTATVGTTNLRCGLTGGVTAVVCPAGMYRVSLYLVVTATGTGTLTSTVGWNDGTAARTITSTGVVTTATNYEQNSYVVKLDGTNDLTYATTLTISGTYALAIRVEKIEQ